MWVNLPQKYVDEEFPELVYLFKNREDAHNGTASTIETDFICPCCKKEYKRKIANVVRNKHVSCPTCNDGFSYPEKFMANVLTQLNISFDYHYSDKTWTQKYIYDFRFDYNGSKYIIETDGGLGHGHRNMPSTSSDELLDIDRIKDQLATDNGYHIIRIDCDYKNDRYQYIKQSIINALNGILDLSNIDWNECNIKSLDSMFLKVINCYKKDSIFLDNISELTGIKIRTITKYLNEAMKFGILEKQKLIKNNPYKDIPDGIEFIFDRNNYSSQNKKIYCYEDVIIFNSITDASDYYGFDRSSFSYALNRDGAFKSKHFVYFDTLDKNFDFKPKSDFQDNRNRKMYQYDKTLKLLYVYKDASDLKQKNPKYSYSNIWKSCTTPGRSAYGFIWSYELLTK